MAARDYSKPFSKEELEEIKEIFRSMSTYQEDGGVCYIASHEFSDLCTAIGYIRTPEAIETARKYWHDNFGDTVPMDKIMGCITNSHDTAAVARQLCLSYDKDGNGFISDDEFEELARVLNVNNPQFKETSFIQFVKEADTDQDGRVSVDECCAWVEKFM